MSSVQGKDEANEVLNEIIESRLNDVGRSDLNELSSQILELTEEYVESRRQMIDVAEKSQLKKALQTKIQRMITDL